MKVSRGIIGVAVLAALVGVLALITGETSIALAVYVLIVVGAATGAGGAMLLIGHLMLKRLDMWLIELQANLRDEDGYDH